VTREAWLMYWSRARRARGCAITAYRSPDVLTSLRLANAIWLVRRMGQIREENMARETPAARLKRRLIFGTTRPNWGRIFQAELAGED